MNDNRIGGTLLVAGNLAGIVTMVLHPVAGHGVLSAPEMQRLATLDRLVHGLALAGVTLIFLGTLALTRRLANAGRLPLAALVVFGLAVVSILIAGAMDGFVCADLLSRMVAGDPQLETWRMLLAYTFRINQAFAAIYVVGASVAIMLWSTAMLLPRRVAPGLGIYGLVLGPIILAALFSGNLPPDVHRFGLVVLVQAIWFILAGMLLLRTVEDRADAPLKSGAQPA